MKGSSKISVLVFKTVKLLVSIFYGKAEIEGLENLPLENAVIVANHSQMNGPIVGELFMPENCYIWSAGQMMDMKEVPKYAFSDFWSQKPLWTHPFYKLLSYIIAPISQCIFTNARTIPVYRDGRVIRTFRESVKALKEGRNVLIFPEKDETHNNVINKFEENYIDIAKLYYKKTGIELTFVPMYIAPKLRKLYMGQGIKYDSNRDIADERARISAYLSDEITHIARSLPPHTVVPYRNIPKKRYLTNKDITEVPK